MRSAPSKRAKIQPSPCGLEHLPGDICCLLSRRLQFLDGLARRLTSQPCRLCFSGDRIWSYLLLDKYDGTPGPAVAMEPVESFFELFCEMQRTRSLLSGSCDAMLQAAYLQRVLGVSTRNCWLLREVAEETERKRKTSFSLDEPMSPVLQEIKSTVHKVREWHEVGAGGVIIMFSAFRAKFEYQEEKTRNKLQLFLRNLSCPTTGPKVLRLTLKPGFFYSDFDSDIDLFFQMKNLIGLETKEDLRHFVHLICARGQSRLVHNAALIAKANLPVPLDEGSAAYIFGFIKAENRLARLRPVEGLSLGQMQHLLHTDDRLELRCEFFFQQERHQFEFWLEITNNDDVNYWARVNGDDVDVESLVSSTFWLDLVGFVKRFPGWGPIITPWDSFPPAKIEGVRSGHLVRFLKGILDVVSEVFCGRC
jgi:hypothetical protein